MELEEIHISMKIMEDLQRCISLFHGQKLELFKALNIMLDHHQLLLYMLSQSTIELMEEGETLTLRQQVEANLIQLIAISNIEIILKKV
jgi:predicted nucleic acid-binding protein